MSRSWSQASGEAAQALRRIEKLRQRLEQVVNGGSTTSTDAQELSTELDRQILRYVRLRQAAQEPQDAVDGGNA